MARSNLREVLIVEDEALVRMVAADALADRGIIAWEAGNAVEALCVLNQHPAIGLLFTDVDMPGDMDGVALARLVHDVRPDIGLVITSGATAIANDDLPERATFLGKPYPMDRMVQILETKIGSRQCL